MDRYKVDGLALRHHYSDSTKLERVFSDIEKELKSQNRVVCQFIVNGLEIHEEDEVDYAEMSLKDVTSLEYLAENSQALVHGVVKSWIDALPELITHAEKLAARIRQNGIQKTASGIQHLVQNCEFLIGSLNSLKFIVGDSLVSTVLQWDEVTRLTKKAVSEASVAMQKKDSSLLADVIEYDLNQALQKWHEVLEKLAHKMNVTEQTGSEDNATNSTESEKKSTGEFPSHRRRQIVN